jgi:hypothetical protein
VWDELTVAAVSLARSWDPDTPISCASRRWKVNRLGCDPAVAVNTSFPLGWPLLNCAEKVSSLWVVFDMKTNPGKISFLDEPLRMD